MPRKKAAPTTSASYAAPTSTGARWGLMNLDTGQFTVLPTGGGRTTASAGTTAPRTRTRTRTRTKTVATGQPAAQASAGGGPSMTPQAIGRRKQAERARRAKLQQQQQP